MHLASQIYKTEDAGAHLTTCLEKDGAHTAKTFGSMGRQALCERVGPSLMDLWHSLQPLEEWKPVAYIPPLCLSSVGEVATLGRIARASTAKVVKASSLHILLDSADLFSSRLPCHARDQGAGRPIIRLRGSTAP